MKTVENTRVNPFATIDDLPFFRDPACREVLHKWVDILQTKSTVVEEPVLEVRKVNRKEVDKRRAKNKAARRARAKNR